jgi:ATP-dependent Clp protease ATP-binding subunit ClpA
MDHGTLTDNNGRKADFRNVTIIMTTNAGALASSQRHDGLHELKESGDEMAEIKRRRAQPAGRHHLVLATRPRVILKVVDKFLLELENQLHGKGQATFTPKLQSFWRRGFDPQMGARPWRGSSRTRRKVLADEIRSSKIIGGSQATIDVDDDGKVRLVFEEGKRPSPSRDHSVRPRDCQASHTTSAGRRSVWCRRSTSVSVVPRCQG